jgi:hypothetical protein
MLNITYFSLKLLELLVLRFPVCLNLLLGLVSRLLYTLCAVCSSQFPFLLELVFACAELCSHSLARQQLARRIQLILSLQTRPTSLDNLLSFPLSLHTISVSPFIPNRILSSRGRTSRSVWIPAEFCAD